MGSTHEWRWARRRLPNGTYRFDIPADALEATRDYLRSHPDGVSDADVEARFRNREEMLVNFRYAIAHRTGEPLPQDFVAFDLLETLAELGEGDWGTARDGTWRFTLGAADLSELPVSTSAAAPFDTTTLILLDAGVPADEVAGSLAGIDPAVAEGRRLQAESWRYRAVFWDTFGLADASGAPWLLMQTDVRPATLGASNLVRAAHLQRHVGNGRWMTTDMYAYEPDATGHNGRIVARTDLVAEARGRALSAGKPHARGSGLDGA